MKNIILIRKDLLNKNKFALKEEILEASYVLTLILNYFSNVILKLEQEGDGMNIRKIIRKLPYLKLKKP